MPAPIDRIVFTLKWHGLTVAVLFRMVANVAEERGQRAWNPLDAENQGNTIVLGRILSNTLEQFVLFAFSSIVLSIYLNATTMRLIPIFVMMWVIGRLMFEYGYKLGPQYRSPGFASTFFATLVPLTMLSYHQFYEGPWVLSLFSAYFASMRLWAVLQFLGGKALGGP